MQSAKYVCTCYTRCGGYNDTISYTTWKAHARFRQRDDDFPGWWEHPQDNGHNAGPAHAQNAPVEHYPDPRPHEQGEENEHPNEGQFGRGGKDQMDGERAGDNERVEVCPILSLLSDRPT
jgi:hypothetical protein